MPAQPPRPSDQQLTTVAASVTQAEAKRLRAIAEAQSVSMTKLVRKALEQVYGTAEKPITS